MKAESKFAFFKQSGWMVIATFVGGLFMTFVHTAAKKMPTSEYSTFVALLRVLVMMGIPAGALQVVFAQQAATVKTEEDSQRLIATTRAILKVTFGIWLLLAVSMLAGTKSIAALLKVNNPAALWFTIALGLTTLWGPIFRGLLQGKHHFAGLGWLQITDGVGRFSAMIVLIVYLHYATAGGMFAALLGQLISVGIGAWLTREIWRSKTGGIFAAKSWLNEVVPLTLGISTTTLMSSLDMLFVQSIFPNENLTGLYGGAMLTGFAIVQFIAPVTSVMFSRIARSVAHSEGTNSLSLTIAITAGFGLIAALGCTILPKLPLQIIYSKTPEMWNAAPLVPWFGWALFPLTVANVLVQNVLARRRFKAVPWLIVVPIAYAATLAWMSPRLLSYTDPFQGFKQVVMTLGLFSVALCAVAALFTWKK